MIHEVIIDGVRYVPTASGENWWVKALRELEPDYPTGAWGANTGHRKASGEAVAYNASQISKWYLDRVAKVAGKKGLAEEVLLGLFDRESNHGRSLDARGYGDRGRAFGVGQVDCRFHTPIGKPYPLSEEHMAQCCDILEDCRSKVATAHSDWPDKYILKGALVAYNSGVKNVVTIDRMDRGTTGGDYGADVTARAQIWAELLKNEKSV